MIPNPETMKEKMYECDNIKNIVHITKNTNKIKDRMGGKFPTRVIDKVLIVIINKSFFKNYFKQALGPSWFCPVARALACRLKGPEFDSIQGHVPELQAQSPVRGMQKAANP